MIDPSFPLASWFLWVSAGLFLVVFALPLTFAPFAWARWLRWRVDAESDLARYWGRCVGVLADAIVLSAFRAAPHPRQNKPMFELIIAAGALMALLHAWGALRKQQPWTETAEIGLYTALSGGALAVYLHL